MQDVRNFGGGEAHLHEVGPDLVSADGILRTLEKSYFLSRQEGWALRALAEIQTHPHANAELT